MKTTVTNPVDMGKYAYELHQKINNILKEVSESILLTACEIGKIFEKAKEEGIYKEVVKNSNLSPRSIRVYKQIYNRREDLQETDVIFTSIRQIVKALNSTTVSVTTTSDMKQLKLLLKKFDSNEITTEERQSLKSIALNRIVKIEKLVTSIESERKTLNRIIKKIK